MAADNVDLPICDLPYIVKLKGHSRITPHFITAINESCNLSNLRNCSRNNENSPETSRTNGAISHTSECA